MAIKGVFYVFAPVTDLARSKRFYGETLGWKLGTDEKDVAGFAFGSGYLVIHAANGSVSVPETAEGFHVAVQVDDANAEHKRLQQLGVAVSDLRDQPWGQRDFSFRDPDGYLWYYGQATRGTSA
jgi:catechol 2,3-dioxygenase-like lactoylglutathione lyase family enzyme